MSKYFLLSVSNRRNLDLCRKYALAGFTESLPGVWAYVDIDVGDYVSFLYGAKAHDLYQVKTKHAIENASEIGPWDPITFQESGKTYHFPFRLQLKPLRKFEQSLVREEFAYVAQNLLLRGGYRKTHFQGDQTTLQYVSQLREVHNGVYESFSDSKMKEFEPTFVHKKHLAAKPRSFQLNEVIIQSLLRHHLSDDRNLKQLLQAYNIGLESHTLEALGEKALPEGHLDILIKEAIPMGDSKNIVIEVKARDAAVKDISQLSNYRRELGPECLAAIIIAKRFPTKMSTKAKAQNIFLGEFDIQWNDSKALSFSQLLQRLSLTFLH